MVLKRGSGMDVPATRNEIVGYLARIADAQKRQDLQARLDDILARHGAAQDQATRQTIEAELSTLRGEAETAASGAAGPNKGAAPAAAFLTLGGFALVLVVTILSFAFLFFYFYMLGGKNFTSMESVRPLLVLTLILSMLGFGGLLIIRALFAPYGGDELQNRFRLGREIFLVFSGIFGTIIGFYFGSEDDEQAAVPTVEAAFAAGRVTGAVVGGTAPFVVIYTPAGATGGTATTSNGRAISIPVAGPCPQGATLLVVDGMGRRADGKIDCTAAGNAGTPIGLTNGATGNTSAATNTAVPAVTTNGQ
jgi:hypothetical protein